MNWMFLLNRVEVTCLQNNELDVPPEPRRGDLSVAEYIVSLAFEPHSGDMFVEECTDILVLSRVAAACL